MKVTERVKPFVFGAAMMLRSNWLLRTLKLRPYDADHSLSVRILHLADMVALQKVTDELTGPDASG